MQGLVSIFEVFLSLLEVTLFGIELFRMEIVEEVVNWKCQVQNSKCTHYDRSETIRFPNLRIKD